MKLKLALSAALLMGGLSQASIASESDIVASVNGHDISKSTLQFYALERRQGNPKSKVPTEQLIDDLINMQLLKEEAHKKKLDKTVDFEKRMDFINLSMLSQVAMVNYLDSNPIPEASLKKEYDQRIGEVKIVELKASHILLKDEEKAKEVIELLNKGGDFAELAKKHSTGPTGPKGGDLGWFTPQRMVPEFSQAVLALKDGEYTPQAIRTQFGLHIILRAAERVGTPPSFESVKQKINATLEQQHIQKHIQQLRKSATITLSKNNVNK
ncbi:peptidylprolyl isomerase [Cycloclasticus sp. 46_120_T64]|nr:peptidylprolyl isomerase [Cycloclasticus sp. 46_120_T64]